MPLETVRAIDKLGFRRWYERQLIEGHLWLVTALLCGFTVLVCLELADFRVLGQATLAAVFIFFAGLMCWYALRRFQLLMVQAHRLAGQTNCPQCGTYGRFRVLDKSPRMRVSCRHCSREWIID